MSNKKPEEKKADEKLDDNLDEIRQFLKKKKIQNDVLKKLIEKPEFGLSETKKQ